MAELLLRNAATFCQSEVLLSDRFAVKFDQLSLLKILTCFLMRVVSLLMEAFSAGSLEFCQALRILFLLVMLRRICSGSFLPGWPKCGREVLSRASEIVCVNLSSARSASAVVFITVRGSGVWCNV
ncbi:hypothetical protein CDAR_278781 [Caerostris darwini]|uniref:Uncharacterized protein n=1 Tax=Caerostris darwini TaxID=1538125 RepID=A0AAV4WNE5_9ARAC|nr:hypothetical protein CDAR_278781 [Caerostris darwini]